MESVGLISFLGTVVVMSLSGVLMPGPITTVTVARGAADPHAGAWVAIGHGVVELPVMALIYFGVGALFQQPAVKIGLGLAGGGVLLGMGAGMLRGHDQAAVGPERPGGKSRSPLAAGAVLSAGNPYFLVWWATVGAALIQSSWTFGALGFLLLALCHWLCDLIWYYFLSALTFRGGRFFGRRLQEGVFIICGLCLLFFAGYFTAGAVLQGAAFGWGI